MKILGIYIELECIAKKKVPKNSSYPLEFRAQS